MLAVLAEPPLVDPALVYEPKYDGVRAIALVEPGRGTAAVRIWSRRGRETTAQFPDVAAALATWGAACSGPVVLDGEIVALDADGRPAGFQRLLARLQGRGPSARSPRPPTDPGAQPAAFIAFDLLRVGDLDLRARPLEERRAALEALFARARSGSPAMRLAEQARGDGRALHARAQAEGWEGLMVKQARSPYRAGRRTAEWRKLKLARQGRFVVGGWTDPRGARPRLGALMLGTREHGGLRYVGDVGTGFTDAEIERLWRRLAALGRDTCPFTLAAPAARHGTHWVEPAIEIDVRYIEVTNEGRLRHPVYLGLAEPPGAGGERGADRAAAVEVAPPASPAPPAGPAGQATSPARPAGLEALVAQIDDLERRRRNGRLALPDGRALEATNLDKVLWPAIGRTKGDLLRHYVRMAPHILPVLADRPLVMHRRPDGADRPGFYQHRAPEPVPAGVRVEAIPNDDVPARLVGGSLQTLLYMAQLAAVSMDPWFSRVDALDTPDQAALDLDPQPGCPFARVLDVARWIRDELDRAGVAAWPKTSGSRGLHLYVPLPPGTPYRAALLFCQIVAAVVAARHPEAATVERTVGRRRAGVVYVDCLQNVRGKTLASAYSARASAFAGVSAPVAWAELEAGIRPEDFTIDTMPARLAAAGDLWATLRAAPGPDLIAAAERLRR